MTEENVELDSNEKQFNPEISNNQGTVNNSRSHEGRRIRTNPILSRRITPRKGR